MKSKVLLIFYGIICSSFAFNTPVRSQQVFKTTKTSVIAYLEYLPQDYHLNSNKYPVVIFLHGSGERGLNTQDTTLLSQSIQEVAKLGPPMYVKNGNQFPFILISPQLKENYSNWPSDYVLEVINYIKTYLRIDEKRIYLTGLSLGGGGAWWTAQDYPELFAALAPVCGGRNTLSKACAIASESLPVWAFHGDKDSIVPMSRSINMVNAINDCVPAPDPKAKITIYPGVAHNAWTYAYKIDNSIHDPNVYEWMLSFKNTVNAGNKIPDANAGVDKTVSGTSTTIVGSGSDLDGNISAYLWTQLSGPSMATVENKTTSSLYASNLKPGEYVFSFRVTDNGGVSDTDYVKITIDNSNQLPVANAGADKLVILPSNSVTISGSATDSDGSIASYHWIQKSGAACNMTSTTSPSLNVSGLKSGSYIFILTVSDNMGLNDYDDVLINVTLPPVVDAGADQLVNLPLASVILTGSAWDPDGTIKNYAWSKYSGPAAYLANNSTPLLTITDLKEGTYVYMLRVSDNLNAKTTDYVTVTVKKEILTISSSTSTSSKIAEIDPDTFVPKGSQNERTKAILDRMSSLDLENCLVAIFNGSGDRIFSGAWTLEKYNEVFTQSGLYIYHIIKEGRRIDTGKIYIKH